MKLFCGTEEPQGSAGQTRKDARLAKKAARKEQTGCLRLEGNSPHLHGTLKSANKFIRDNIKKGIKCPNYQKYCFIL